MCQPRVNKLKLSSTKVGPGRHISSPCVQGLRLSFYLSVHPSVLTYVTKFLKTDFSKTNFFKLCMLITTNNPQELSVSDFEKNLLQDLGVICAGSGSIMYACASVCGFTCARLDFRLRTNFWEFFFSKKNPFIFILFFCSYYHVITVRVIRVGGSWHSCS